MAMPELASCATEARQQIVEQGYANVQVDLGKRACEELFSNFKDFVTLCQEPGGDKLANAVAHSVNTLGNGDYFLTQRVPGVHNPHELAANRAAGRDHKYVLHYGPQTTLRAQSKLGDELPAEMNVFLENCEDAYQAGRSAARIGAVALGLEDTLLPDNIYKDVHLLRVIDYIASDAAELGEAHFDRAVATLAMSESHPGLRGIPADNGYLKPLGHKTIERLSHGLVPVKHYEGVAKFFAAAGLRRLPENIRAANTLDDVPLFAHDVINERAGENRQALILFMNPHLDFSPYSIPSKQETSVNFGQDNYAQAA